MGLKAASSLVQGPLTLFSLYHMLIWCFLWNTILSLCALQCFCGGEAAVYAHASRQASGYKNRSAVHKQSQVRCRHLMKQHICFHTFHYPICLLVQWKLRHFVRYFTDNNVFSNVSRLLVKFPELNYQLKIKVCIDKWVWFMVEGCL